MPRLVEKHKVLNGRAEIITYDRDPNAWYYRQKLDGEKAYTTRRIQNATTKQEAEEASILLYVATQNKLIEPKQVRTKQASSEEIVEHLEETEFVTPDARLSANAAEHDNGVGGAYLLKDRSEPLRTGRFINRRRKGIHIEDAINAYIAELSDRVEANELKANTFKEYLQTLSVHLTLYFKEEGIKFTSQINADSFTRYPLYRKWASKLTKNKEARHIKAFVDHYLAKKRLIDVEVATNKKLIPLSRITQEDLDANPAINKEDWSKINSYIRNVYLKVGADHPRPSVYYWRYLFWNFTLIMKNTGCRPVELLNLRWKDITIEDVGRISRTKLQEDIEYYESEGIQVMIEEEDLNPDPNAWARSPNQLGREERLIAHVFIRASKTGKQREVSTHQGIAFKRFKEFQDEYCRINDLESKPSPESLVFGNPHKYFEKYTYNTYTVAWNKIRDAVKEQLIGHKFSDRSYTIYSMRSTFIENALLARMDIFLLSRICGHSVEMLQKHYERIDVKERAEEVTRLPYGAKKDTGKIPIDLFKEE